MISLSPATPEPPEAEGLPDDEPLPDKPDEPNKPEQEAIKTPDIDAPKIRTRAQIAENNFFIT